MTSANDGSTEYFYFQLSSPSEASCYLIFAAKKQNESTILSIIDASFLSDHLNNAIQITDTNVPCLPFGWDDINGNGYPDISVGFLWGNRLAGSELHIFEVTDEHEVKILTQELPGIVSPWNYAADNTELVVWDFDWVHHDCFYPPLYLFKVFTWKNDSYVNITEQSEFFSNYVDSQTEQIIDRYGQPLHATFWMKPITILLLMHDRAGEREQGWQLFTEMTSKENWPGSTEQDFEWLESDVLHFSEQYSAGTDFTPNDYCPGYE